MGYHNNIYTTASKDNFLMIMSTGCTCFGTFNKVFMSLNDYVFTSQAESVSVFYHVLNFTADVGNETWLTADDDIRETAEDEIQDTSATAAAVEPPLENDIAITADGENLEGNVNSDVVVAVTSTATVEISAEERLEQRKPEEELFLLVDDDLDSDIISTHAAAFHRIDPQLDPPAASAAAVDTALAQLSSTTGKTSAAGGGTEVQSADNTDVVSTQNNAGNTEVAAAAKTTTTMAASEKASPKRLVFGC